MQIPSLRLHGEYIHPECQPVAGGDGQGAFGQSTPKHRPETRGKGILKRFRKDERVAKFPISFGWIKAAYADAIEYTGITNAQRGLGFFVGIFCIALFGGAAIWGGFWPKSFDWDDLFGTLLGASMAIGSGLFGLFAALFLGRLEFFGLTDEPILFDRRRRKVYRIFREAAPGWTGLLQRWPTYAVENDWDLIDVEHNAAIATSGTVVSQQHSLTFLVRKSADDPTVIDFFNVGQIAVYTEQSVPPVWEHIRRFMEEDGPHTPDRDGLFVAQVPQNFWQALRGALPMGPMPVRQWVSEHPFIAVFFVLLSPWFGPMYFIAGIGNWLSHKTATPIQWPQAVLDAVGPPLNGQQIKAAQDQAWARDRERALRPPPPPPPPPVPKPRPPATEPPLALLHVAHPGGPLQLHHEGPHGGHARFVVVDAQHQVHKGALDSTGHATVADVAAGEASVAYFKPQE